MKKTTLLTIAIVALLVLNVTVLAVVFFKPHLQAGPGHKEPREIIIEKLHFNTGQVQAYEKLIAVHRSEINRLDSGIREKKQELYALLSTHDATQKDSLIAAINSYQKQIEETHYRHFEDIKKLCTPQQQPYFKALAQELPRLFAPHPQGGRPGPP